MQINTLDKIYTILLFRILLYKKIVWISPRRSPLQKKYIPVQKIGKNLKLTNRSGQQKLNNTVPRTAITNIYLKIAININGKKEIAIIDSDATENFIIKKYIKK